MPPITAYSQPATLPAWAGHTPYAAHGLQPWNQPLLPVQPSPSYRAGFLIDKRLILFFRLYIMSHQLPSAISPH